jgi:hypothetical protein
MLAQAFGENSESENVLECKKNKTTKQAEKKRKKRKTGALISIRVK